MLIYAFKEPYSISEQSQAFNKSGSNPPAIIKATKLFRNLMLSVTEAKLLVSGPSPVSASLSEDLTRLEIIFDRNIAGNSQSCDQVFTPATAVMLKGRIATSIFSKARRFHSLCILL
jgi:hypothetical protein